MRTNFLFIFVSLMTASVCAAFAQAHDDLIGPPTTLLSEAQSAYRSGKFPEAIEKFNKLISAAPSSPDAYAGLVLVYLKENKVDLADETVKKGLAINPSASAMQTAAGELYFRQGKFAEAERQFVQVINSGAKDARAYLGLARIRSATSMYKQEKELLERAHALDAADPDVQKYWMGTLKRGERIKFLENYLAQPSNEEPSEREHLNHYLELLREREQNSRRNCQLVSKLESTETPLRPLMLDASKVQGLGLMVSFNDHNSRLLLDTGASGLTVKKSIAEKAGIVPIVHSTQGGIGDAKAMGVYLGYANSIHIGDLEFQNCLVTVTDKSLGGTEDGLIGSDVFSRYLVDIDFQHQVLKLSQLPKRPDDTAASVSASLNTEGNSDEEHAGEQASQGKEEKPGDESKKLVDRGPQDRYIAPEMQGYTRILRFGHILLVPTRVSDTPARWFIIDSGAALNGITPTAAREVTKVRTDYDLHIKGMSGEVNQVFSADKAVLQFAHFRQENQDITSWDLSGISKNIGTEVSGLLGFKTLHLFDLKIDYRDGLVDFGFSDKASK